MTNRSTRDTLAPAPIIACFSCPLCPWPGPYGPCLWLGTCARSLVPTRGGGVPAARPAADGARPVARHASVRARAGWGPRSCAAGDADDMGRDRDRRQRRAEGEI